MGDDEEPDGVATVETVAEMWGEAERTMYRRLEEFREVWAPAGYDTPDPIADVLIADYRTREQSLVGNAASSAARDAGAGSERRGRDGLSDWRLAEGGSVPLRCH